MEGKKLFLLSFIVGLITFSLCAIIFALSHGELIVFIEDFIGI